MSSTHGHWTPLGTGALTTENADVGLGHIVPVKTYVNILLILLVLTALTVGVSRIDLGAWNTVVAIVVATIKAILVACFFMHLKFEKKLIILYAIYPLVILFLLIGSTVKDGETREDPSDGTSPIETFPAQVIHMDNHAEHSEHSEH